MNSETDASTWTFNNSGSMTFTGLDLNKTYTVVVDTSTGKIEIEGYSFVTASPYEVAPSSVTQYEGTITNTYKLSGVELPATDGIGTAAYNAIGTLMILAAGVLLAKRK